MATPTTELRPNPITWKSQAETYTQSKIIGGKAGSKIKYLINKYTNITYGVFNHEGIWAHHIKLNYKQINLAGYKENKTSFFALEYNSKVMNSTIVFEPKESFSKSIEFNIKNACNFLIELEYRFNTKKINYTNFGLRKYYKSNNSPLKGFLSVNYNPILNNQVTGQILIHIISDLNHIKRVI